VLIPDLRAGCSLAASITAADVRLMRERYPDAPVVAYVNTSAEVKAASDICCTSANAKKIVESLGASRVIMLPDEYLAQNTAKRTDVEIIAWAGHCEVHERFTAAEVRTLRAEHPGLVVLAHPECPPEVMPARGDRRGRLHRLHRRHVRLRQPAPAAPRRAVDRMFHERQRRGA